MYHSVPLRMKDCFNMMAPRDALLHGARCWEMKKWEEAKVRAANIRLLRWMCSH